MSIGSLFSVARSAMNAHQTAIQTAGHNIANVETPGYSRQRVELKPSVPQFWPSGSVGTGVTIATVARVRDTLLDASYRREASGAAGSEMRHELLGAIEQVLGEPSEDGLASAMDAFWSSWSDLSSNPTSAAARSVVQQRGANVSSMLNSFAARLTEIREQTTLELDNALGELNGLSDQVAQLNARVVEAEINGKPANDLRDERDRAVDGLAKFGELRSFEARDGSVQVVLGNITIVDGIRTQHLSGERSGGVLRIIADGASEPALPIGGSVTALVDFLNGGLDDMQSRLDRLASSMVEGVNAAHRLGQTYSSTGAALPPNDFFHPGDTNPNAPPALLPVTAANIRLSNAVRASATAIAASAITPTPGQTTGPGNNEIALRIAGLRTASTSVSYLAADGVSTVTASFGEYFRDGVSRLGAQVKDAESTASVHRTLADQAESRRMSVHGVNLDEELTTLMRAQQAYAAAAKVITAAEEMMRTLVEMV